MTPVERVFTRRLALTGALLSAASVTSASLISSAARATPLGSIKPPPILPRQTWAQGLSPTGPLPAETVKCLVIHHTASSNGYASDAVPAMLRSFYHHHTTTKGWPDVAYNFFVDAYGTIYEGRKGSLAGPVAGSATGGNQGCTQLCCFIGNFTSAAPTPKATQAMASLVAWLAHRYDVDLLAKSVSFTSRGSNKHAEGSTITVPPVAGHRDLSLTACPGEAGYAAIATTILPAARAISLQATRLATPTRSTSSTSTRPPDAQPNASTTSTNATSTATEESPAPDVPATTEETLVPAGPTVTRTASESASPQVGAETAAENSNAQVNFLAAGAAAAATAAAGGAAYLYRHRTANKPTD